MSVRPTLPDLLGLGDFQKTHLWNVSLLRKPSALAIDTTRFNLQCKTSGVPKESSEAIEDYIRGRRIFDTGVYYPEGTITLTFLETVDAQVREMIRAWVQICNDRTDTFDGVTADIRLVTQNNQQNDNYEYILKWAFIEDSDIEALVARSPEFMSPSITLRYVDLAYGRIAG